MHPHISIKAEKVFEISGFPVTNSLLSTVIVFILFTVLAILFYLKREDKKSTFVFFILFLIRGLFNLFEGIFKEKTRIFFPLLASFFLYILLSNWFGLIPGVGSILISHGHEAMPILRGSTADLNTTIALALISFSLIQFYGVKYLGLAGYLKKFLNFSNPVAFFTGILEIVSEISKIISFAFRLFGNIFAGEVLLVVVAFLIPILASFPFLMLELFVGMIQALVFSLLTGIFINLSIAKHH